MDDEPEVGREERKFPSYEDKHMALPVNKLNEGLLQESVLVVTMRDLQLSEHYFNGRNIQSESSVSMDIDEDIARGL